MGGWQCPQTVRKAPSSEYDNGWGSQLTLASSFFSIPTWTHSTTSQELPGLQYQIGTIEDINQSNKSPFMTCTYSVGSETLTSPAPLHFPLSFPKGPCLTPECSVLDCAAVLTCEAKS